jgi:hypothetical protein
MLIANYITEYYPLFLEALVSIIIFYTLFLIYIKYIHLQFATYLIKKQFENQMQFYSSINQIPNKDEIKYSIQATNTYLEDKHNSELEKINNKNEKLVNNIVIIGCSILGVLILIAIAIPLFGFYDWSKIDFKLLIFAFLLHGIFIIALESYLLFVVVENIPVINLSKLF